jgi:DNA polymerase III subunit delta
VTPDALAEEVVAGTLRPAYLLVGEEALLRDDALARLREAVLSGAPPDFDLDRLAGESTSPAALLDAVDTLPVTAPKRLVILSEPEARRGARGLAEALPEVLARVGATSTCVLVVVAHKADRRARWVKAFGETVIDCAAPTRARDIAAFVRAEAGRQGVSLARGAAEALAERIGPQLLLLRSEIAKLALLAGPDEPVTREHVAAGTVEVAEAPIWDLTDAIGEGRTADALGVLVRLLAAGAPAPVVLGALVSHFRRLLRVGHGAAVPGPPFVRKKLESQAQRYGPRRLRGSIEALHQTDLALKGAGALSPELALERLVIALAS